MKIENKYEASVFMMGRGINKGNWEAVMTFTAYCYGSEGDEPGEVPVSVAEVTQDGAVIGWVVAETPDECTNIVGIWDTKNEAHKAAESYAQAQDESAS